MMGDLCLNWLQWMFYFFVLLFCTHLTFCWTWNNKYVLLSTFAFHIAMHTNIKLTLTHTHTKRFERERERERERAQQNIFQLSLHTSVQCICHQFVIFYIASQQSLRCQTSCSNKQKQWDKTCKKHCTRKFSHPNTPLKWQQSFLLSQHNLAQSFSTPIHTAAQCDRQHTRTSKMMSLYFISECMYR
jgi:hypothetical protein